MKFVGIDPGAKGAIAFLNEDGSIDKYLHYEDINMKRLLEYLKDKRNDFRVVIEKLWGMPLRGAQGNWSLGGNYKNWQLILELADISNVEIPPQTWQQAILHTSKKKAKETKPLSLAYVNKRYPALNLPCKKASEIDLYSGVSDAVCLALYCRHLHLNRL